MRSPAPRRDHGRAARHGRPHAATTTALRPEGRQAGRRTQALVVAAPGEVALEQRDRPVPGPGRGADPARPWSGCAAPTWTSWPAGSTPPTSATRWSSGTSGPARCWPGGGRRAGPGHPGGRRGHRAVRALRRAAGAGETNLCATYDEMGFTRDGAAAGYAAVGEALVHPLAPAVSCRGRRAGRAGLGGLPGAGQHHGRAGRRALVVGDGTVALLAVRLLGLWSPGRDRDARPPRRARPAWPPTAGAARFETEPARPAAATTWWWRRPGPPARCSPRWPRRAAAAPCCCSACRRTAPPRPSPWTTWSTTT